MSDLKSKKPDREETDVIQPPLDASQCMQILTVLQQILATMRESDTSQQILTTIQKSTIMKPETTDVSSRFWMRYKAEADEYDKDLLDKYNGDLDIALIFAGLFSAVCATFIVLVQPAFGPDPNDVTHALLQMLILTVNGTAPQSIASTLPTWTGPSQRTTWIQALFIGAMGCSLFAAMVAVLGKRWLIHFSQAGIRGTLADRGKDRQWKLEGLYKWGLTWVLGGIPLFLQTSLFLFGVGTSLYLWDQHTTLGIIFTVMTSLAGLLYTLFTLAPLFFPNCPFRTPLTNLIGLFMERFVFEPALVLAKFVVRKVATARRSLSGPTRPTPLTPGTILGEGDHTVSHGSDPEAQRPSHLDDPNAKSLPSRLFGRAKGALSPTDVPSLNGRTDAAAILWVLETSDDPAARELAMEYALEVDWPNRVLLFPLLDRLLADLRGCFTTSPGDTFELVLEPSRTESAITYGRAFLFFYWAHRYDDIRSWRVPASVEKAQGEYYRPMDSHPGLDEFFGVRDSVMATLNGHTSRRARSELSAFLTSSWFQKVDFPSSTSSAAVATASFILGCMLSDPHLKDGETLGLLARHIIDLGVPGLRAQATPSVKRHFFQAFAMISKRIRTLPHPQSCRLAGFSGFDGRSLMDQLDETTRQLVNTPKGYPIATVLWHRGNVFGLLLFLMSVSWPLRSSSREAGHAGQCLNQCKELFSLAEERLDLDSTYNYLLSLLYLSLFMMDTNPTSHHKPSAKLPEFVLSPNDKKALIPHFTWIQVSLHSHVSSPDEFDLRKDPDSIPNKDLIARGFSAIGHMFQADDPSLFGTVRLPALASTLYSCLRLSPTSTPQSIRFDYMAAVSCARDVMESILRHLKQNRRLPPSLALGDLLSSSLIFGILQDDTCHAAFVEVIQLLSELLRSSDAVYLSEADVTTVIREWPDKYEHYRNYNDSMGRAHVAWSAVARIILRYGGIEKCLDLENLWVALDIALVAWGGDLEHSTPPTISDLATGHSETQTCPVKITPQVARGTLSLLSQVPPHIARGRLNEIRAVSQNRRDDDELDFPPSGADRGLLDEVHAEFVRLAEVPPAQEDVGQTSGS